MIVDVLFGAVGLALAGLFLVVARHFGPPTRDTTESPERRSDRPVEPHP